MIFPGVIERPLLPDEISIYLDNTRPIPLSALATFLSKIDKEARTVEGMDGLFLELSDFALGSNELRVRVVGPGRLAREEAARQERIAKAAEVSARAAQKSATAAVVSAGAAVVSAVAAAVTVAMISGNANPPTYRIVKQYNVQNIYVRAPEDEAPRIVTKKEIQMGRQRRLSAKDREEDRRREKESRALLQAMDSNRMVDLAGWFYFEPHRGYFFETMYGNRFPVHFPNADRYESTPVALRTIVHDSPSGLQLEGVEVITTLSDY